MSLNYWGLASNYTLFWSFVPLSLYFHIFLCTWVEISSVLWLVCLRDEVYNKVDACISYSSSIIEYSVPCYFDETYELINKIICCLEEYLTIFTPKLAMTLIWEVHFVSWAVLYGMILYHTNCTWHECVFHACFACLMNVLMLLILSHLYKFKIKISYKTNYKYVFTDMDDIQIWDVGSV